MLCPGAFHKEPPDIGIEKGCSVNLATWKQSKTPSGHKHMRISFLGQAQTGINRRVSISNCGRNGDISGGHLI